MTEISTKMRTDPVNSIFAFGIVQLNAEHTARTSFTYLFLREGMKYGEETSSHRESSEPPDRSGLLAISFAIIKCIRTNHLLA